MGPRGRQKPSLFLVVAGGCGGVRLPCVQGSVSFLFEKIRSCHDFLSVKVIGILYG